jgi:hypothetical protein
MAVAAEMAAPAEEAAAEVRIQYTRHIWTCTSRSWFDLDHQDDRGAFAQLRAARVRRRQSYSNR